MLYDVFISHSSKNKNTADAICGSLEKNNIRCWIAPRDVTPGKSYPSEIIKGIKNCALFLLIFSAESNDSPAVLRETERAVMRYGKTVIPFRLDDVKMNDDIEFLLANVHYIDAQPNDTEFKELIKTIKNTLKAKNEGDSAAERKPVIAAPEPGGKNGKKNKRSKFITIAASVFTAAVLFAAGLYMLDRSSTEVFALAVDPQYVTLSLQQTSELAVNKIFESGDMSQINPNSIIWVSNDGSIAQIDGSRIIGLNLGRTVIRGEYENHIIELYVNVVEPVNGMTDIAQRYERGRKVTLYGGTAEERAHTDGHLDGEAEFVSPESICISEDGTVYITDSGFIRRIKNGAAESVEIEPFYMTPRVVRCRGNEVYILTREWEELDGTYNYGIVRLEDAAAEFSTVEEIYISNAGHTYIEDFAFLPGGGLMYYIESNTVLGGVYLKTMNLLDTEDITTLCVLPEGTRALSISADGTVYLSNAETGVIQYYREGELRYFAGAENEKHFIDGSAPLFFMPLNIKYADGALYVWDFNVLRKITAEDGGAADSITLAGEASPEFELEDIEKEYTAEDVIFANSYTADFALAADGRILLTDPKRGVIWAVE